MLLVPDRHDDGTNVISVPVDLGFRFSYGPSSFSRHLAQATSLGAQPEVFRDERLSIDIDLPEDLALVRTQTRSWGPEGPHVSQSG